MFLHKSICVSRFIYLDEYGSFGPGEGEHEWREEASWSSIRLCKCMDRQLVSSMQIFLREMCLEYSGARRWLRLGPRVDAVLPPPFVVVPSCVAPPLLALQETVVSPY